MLGLFLAGGSLLAGAERPGRLVEAGLAAERRQDPRAALEHFRAAGREFPEDAFIQQKIAQQLSDLAFLTTDAAERVRLAEAALPHAERAARLDPRSAVALLSLAVLHGKLAVEGDAATKIEYARRIRRQAEEALALDPEYAWARHVLGRWHVELAQVGLAKRAVVAVFFGGLPEASLAEGIRLLEEAVRLEPDAVAHHNELGFAYRQAGRTGAARASWEKALSLPSVALYDETAKSRARAGLAGLGRD